MQTNQGVDIAQKQAELSKELLFDQIKHCEYGREKRTVS